MQVSAPGSGSTSNLLNQNILVINQKTKLIEVNTEFGLYSKDGLQLGSVRQVGQSRLKKVFRFVDQLDQFFTHKFQVVDASGRVVLGLTRPRKFFLSRVVVTDAFGADVGEIVQQNVFGKIRFLFYAGGQEVGGIFAENWRAWNFAIRDSDGREVARVTKTFEGILRTLYTSADHYVLEVHEELEDPLRQFVFATAVSIDIALKQDARGLGRLSIFDLGS